MDYRTVHIGPYHHLAVTESQLAISVHKPETLRKRLDRAPRNVNPHSPLLKESTILIVSTATAHVKKHVTILSPYIKTDVASTHRHRL